MVDLRGGSGSMSKRGVQVRGGTWTNCLYPRVVRRLRPRGAEVSGAANRWIKSTTIGCMGLTVIGVRGGLAVCVPRVAILRGWLWWSACWLAWCSGVSLCRAQRPPGDQGGCEHAFFSISTPRGGLGGTVALSDRCTRAGPTCPFRSCAADPECSVCHSSPRGMGSMICCFGPWRGHPSPQCNSAS